VHCLPQCFLYVGIVGVLHMRSIRSFALPSSRLYRPIESLLRRYELPLLYAGARTTNLWAATKSRLKCASLFAQSGIKNALLRILPEKGTDETSRAKASSEGGQEQEPSPQATQQIVDMGSTVVKNRHGTVHCLTIVGQVEGHMVLPNNTKSTKYEHVLPLLASLEESDEVDGLVLLLNTVGGDIEAGLAIAELVAGMRLPTVTLVLGGGHSIGVPLAVCGKETFIATPHP